MIVATVRATVKVAVIVLVVVPEIVVISVFDIYVHIDSWDKLSADDFRCRIFLNSTYLSRIFVAEKRKFYSIRRNGGLVLPAASVGKNGCGALYADCTPFVKENVPRESHSLQCGLRFLIIAGLKS